MGRPGRYCHAKALETFPQWTAFSPEVQTYLSWKNEVAILWNFRSVPATSFACKSSRNNYLTKSLQWARKLLGHAPGVPMRKLVSALAFVATMWSVTAQASPIRYEFTSTLAPVAPNTGSNFAGYVQFDSSLLVPNTTINVASFTSWAFTWGTTFAWSNSTASFDPNPAFTVFTLGPALQVNSAALCFSAPAVCGTGAHPVALVLTSGVFATVNPIDQVFGSGSWSGPIAAAVPEPASFALLGLGLTALTVLRWKRKQ